MWWVAVPSAMTYCTVCDDVLFRLRWRTVPSAMTYCTICDDVLYRLLCQGPAQLWASGNPSCCWYITKCTQKADMPEITQGRQGPALFVQNDSSLVVKFLLPAVQAETLRSEISGYVLISFHVARIWVQKRQKALNSESVKWKKAVLRIILTSMSC